MGDDAKLELLVLAGDGVAVHRLPARGTVLIGRGDGSDVRVDHASVSRKHAALHVGDKIVVEDLGSVNGTRVRAGAPVEAGGTFELRQIHKESVPIAIGDAINVGSTMIVVRRADEPSNVADEGAGDGGKVVIDPAMRALYRDAHRAAKAPISVLILGETGAGKEVLAREVHTMSSRAGGPFLALNCAALSETLLESELFGHERGAFTGASEARPGLFEAAAKGTVFLDEIGELSMSVQVKLLRVIEDRMVMRVGGRTPKPIDVRFVAATNRDLEAEAQRGSFRQDLFFRLNGITLFIPPLRERPSEILALAKSFLAASYRKLDRRRPPSISSRAEAALLRYAWPGNIRELRNAIDRAAVLCEGDVVEVEHLPQKLRSEPAPSRPVAAPAQQTPPRDPPSSPSETLDTGTPAGDSLKREMALLEKRRIIEALEKCAGNQTHAAELLGMSRRTLISRIEEYDIPRPRKKR